MKRLCVFYNKAEQFLGKRINWIVCTRCKSRLLRGERLKIGYHTQKPIAYAVYPPQSFEELAKALPAMFQRRIEAQKAYFKRKRPGL